jgi:hypothetical protein
MAIGHMTPTYSDRGLKKGLAHWTRDIEFQAARVMEDE